MIRAFVLKWIVTISRGPRSSPVTTNSHVDGNRHAHHYQGAETQDDEPPRHPHDSLGYQKDVENTDRPSEWLPYFDPPVADFLDSWKAATLVLSISTEPVSMNAGTCAKLSRDQSASRRAGLLW